MAFFILQFLSNFCHIFICRGELDTMSRMKQLFQSLKIQGENLPSKTMTLPIMTITGTNTLLIENEYSLLEFSNETIKLKCDAYIIQIAGTDLMISMMYPDEMLLVGKISNITFHN